MLAGVFLLLRPDTPREEVIGLYLSLGRKHASSLGDIGRGVVDRPDLVAGERLADGTADGKTRREGGNARSGEIPFARRPPTEMICLPYNRRRTSHLSIRKSDPRTHH